MRGYIILISAIFLNISTLCSQEEKQLSAELIENISSQIIENDGGSTNNTTYLYENLLLLLQNPINLNQCNKEDLEKIPFLSDRQIENLLYYTYKNFPLESEFEIQLVEGFYKQDVRNLLPFIYIGEASQKEKKITTKDLLKYRKQELITRTDRCLEKKEGYTEGYLGSPYYLYLKYRYQYKKRILIGVTTEKDAGEQIWGDVQKRFDFYSAHLQLNDFGKMKTLAIGDFNASFGQGLVLNTNYGLGKSALVTNSGTRNSGLRKYSSTNEYNFLRGIGSTIKLRKIEFTAFYSNKMIDGDTINNKLSSIKKDGLHRTASDLSKKNTINIEIIGSNFSYQSNMYHIGGTFIQTKLNYKLSPKPYPYNYYYFSTNKQTVGSIDYKFRWHNMFFTGETAMTDNIGFATINTISFNPISSIELLLLQRYYAPSYDVLMSNSFGESSRVNNEEGFYLGITAQTSPNWKLSTYADCYRFPWLKFGVDKPSIGWDMLLMAEYNPSDFINMYCRFRHKEKEKNTTSNFVMATVDKLNKNSFRYVLIQNISKQIQLKTLLESNYVQEGDKNPTWGLLLQQDCSFSLRSIALSFNIRYEFFDAENYENRIYSYEKDVLYAFSIPALCGKGSRYYLNIKYKATEKLSFYFKIAQTSFMNKDIIGSGLEKIDGNKKTDIRVLVKWKW